MTRIEELELELNKEKFRQLITDNDNVVIDIYENTENEPIQKNISNKIIFKNSKSLEDYFLGYRLIGYNRLRIETKRILDDQFISYGLPIFVNV